MSWNYPYLVRTYFYSPNKWLMFLIYPNFFGVTMNSVEGRQHFPSRYNGGLESWPQKFQRTMSKVVHGSAFFGNETTASPEDSKTGQVDQQTRGSFENRFRFFSGLFISRQGLEDLSRFESTIIKAEVEAIKLAKKRALEALMESIRDPERLRMIFDSSGGQKTSSIGIMEFYDSKIKKLTHRERLFYRAYFTRTFELLMQSFVSEMSSMEWKTPMDPATFARKFVHELKAGRIQAIDVTEESIKKFGEDLEKTVDYKQVRRWAMDLAYRGEEFLTRIDMQFRMKLLQSIHPENEQLDLVFQASRMANKPQAMDRAVRAQISSVFSSIPIAIGSTLVLFASVQSGLLQPFDPSGMDTDTHFRYMSRYLFWAGFVPAVLLGMVAGTWMKVQEDARIDKQGGFDRIVQYSDGKRGFWRYYFKNLFKNPANNWRSNQLHYLKIIWHNIPAASVTMIATSLYGLGRVDLGIFVSGYVMIFATPLVGFGMQLHQAFELASTWVKSKIPRRFRAHKAAMQYVDRQIQMYKIKQSYGLNLFNIVVIQGIAGDLFTLADNARYGTRAFIRLFFGGNTLTGWIDSLAGKMVEAFGSIPGVEPSIKAVRHIFTNNFEAWQQFPKELVEANPGVGKVEYDSTLPKNTLGRVLGNTVGAITSLGLLTSAPYIGSHILQSRNEKRIQKRGARIRCSVLFAR